MNAIDLSAINHQFGIPGLRFRNGPGGMVMAEIINPLATASLCLQGAHLTGWSPRGQKPVIWLSPAARFAEGSPIRGGIPICWPWFGSHANQSGFPFHGYARTKTWEVVKTAQLDDESTYLALRLPQTEDTQTWWPHSTALEIRLTVGETLVIELVTGNLEATPIVIGQALHTYFQVGDVRRIEILGLDGCRYIDKLDEGRLKQQVGPVTIASEVDRIYLNAGSDRLIDDPVLSRRIRISTRGSHSTIVWNPWIDKAAKMEDLGENGYLNMVCVETANAAADLVTIPAQAEHRLSVRYSVEK